MLVGAVMGFWAVQRDRRPGRARRSPLAVARRGARRRGDGADPRVPRDHAAREPDRLRPRADDLRRRGRALVVPRRTTSNLADEPARTSSSRSTCSASPTLPVVGPIVFGQTCSSTRRGCASSRRALPLADAAGPQRARGRRVARPRPTRWGSTSRATATRTRSSAARSPASAARASASRSRRSGSTGSPRGAGWIAIALVIFAFWRPDLCLVGAYFFGAF